MSRKLSLTLAAAVVLAFALPSMANATIGTLPAGTKAAVGKKITAEGTNVTLKSNLLGAITCEKININVELIKNTGTPGSGNPENIGEVESKAGAAKPAAQSGCKNGTKSVVVESVTVEKAFSNSQQKSGGTGTGTVSFKATVKIGTELVCKFTGTNIPGTFVSGTNIAKFSEAGTVTSEPSSCGTSKLTAEFANVETGTSVKLIQD